MPNKLSKNLLSFLFRLSDLTLPFSKTPIKYFIPKTTYLLSDILLSILMHIYIQTIRSIGIYPKKFALSLKTSPINQPNIGPKVCL
jgi:hypothetical protein